MHCDAALRDVVQPPISSEEQHDDRDADPCPPEDEECFDAPDAASMDEAISKFVKGLEAQEHSEFDDIHRLLKDLPLPVTYDCADTTPADGRRGSNVYEENLWLWSFACGKPRLGGLSVEKTSDSRGR